MRGEPLIVKQLLQKAKDSALLAIEYYNKPAVSFKSEGFIVMMCIAWTAFFHAYFLKKKVKPWYRKKESGKKPRFEHVIERLDGKEIKDKKWWDLNKCIKEFFKEEDNNPVRKNIEFISGLRNLIVHRHLPELDASIYAECQACVLNFNNFLGIYFGQKQKIDIFLSFSIQLFQSPKNFIEASKKDLKNKNAVEIVEYIKTFRSALTTDILESPEYSFKAVLIQVRGHASKDAIALRFINEKDLSEEQKENLKSLGIVLIKEKSIDGVPSNFSLTYEDLKIRLKDEIPNLKFNKEFHQIKNFIIKEKPSLKHVRRLDPNNPKSPKKDYYDPKIIDEFKREYEKKIQQHASYN